MPDLSLDEQAACVEAGKVPTHLVERSTGLHFCWVWNFKLIDNTDPEYRACNCNEDKLDG